MAGSVHTLIPEILDLWFGSTDAHIADRAPVWWKKDPEFDGALRDRFGDLLVPAAAGAFEAWESTADGALALVILMDQFSRNIHRLDARSFAQDAAAREVTARARAKGFDRVLIAPKRVFLYMPLMHSEHLADHRVALRLFEGLASLSRGGPWQDLVQGNLDFAVKHAAIIQKFGRYPHRNQVLGRDSTPEEAAHVAAHGGF